MRGQVVFFSVMHSSHTVSVGGQVVILGSFLMRIIGHNFPLKFSTQG